MMAVHDERGCHRGVIRRLAGNRDGAAAVEFAVILPLLLLILAVAIDFGSLLYNQFRLNQAVSAAANYTIVNASSVSSSGGSALAANLATIIAGSQTSDWADGRSIVNNGPTAEKSGGKTTTSGHSAAADSCYCPEYDAGSVAWGAGVACGAPCPAGGKAGKFVELTASRDYEPIFSSYGIVNAGRLSVRAMVEVE